MPDFAYIARDLTGQKVTGTLSAGSEREAASALSAQELFPLDVQLHKRLGHRRSPRVRAQLIATTFSQLAALLRSGVPLLKSIDVIRRQSSHGGLVQILDDVYGQVEEGSSLADAFARHPKVFSEMATSIIRAGGEGGFLEEALVHMADFTEKQQDLKSRTMGALAYPIVLSVVGVTVVTVLIIFFVPKFEPLFNNLREIGELPVTTQCLLWASGVLQSWWPMIAIAGAIVVLMGRARLATVEGREWWDRWRLRLPVIGGVFLHLAVARFCRVLGTLLRSGVPILRSLEISSHATGNRVLADAIGRAAENISSGQSLSRPLAACGHFPQDIIEMIAVAEESNTLEKVLIDTADTLDRHTWRRLELLVRLIEPMMLLILACAVLLVVVALVLPMLRMSMTL